MRSSLRRDVGLGLFVLFGVGNIVGAGIYVLVGKVVGAAGLAAPVAFICAALIAGLTGLSYGELAARFPQSAGEAVYLYEAFRRRWLSVGVGLLIALAGLVSAATMVRGFHGYLSVFVPIPAAAVIVLVITGLTLIAVRGIVESTWFVAVLTVAQVAGLVWIIFASAPNIAAPEAMAMTALLPADVAAWSGVLAGAFLAFYAFIGFEDMVNIAEEVREPARTIPRGILLAFLIATVLYVLLTLTAVYTLPPATLAASEAPLADLCDATAACSKAFISLIGLTVINGALIQIIMASRIFYGMSSAGWLPALLSAVHAITRTPVVATALAGLIAVSLALALPLLSLARITSALVLTVFMLVNLALLRIKRRNPLAEGVRVLSPLVPLTGLFGSALILVASQI